MNMPGLTAEASIYKTNLQYRSTNTQGISMRNSVYLAGACKCTDPNCTWMCLSPSPDLCKIECQGLTGCALSRYYCTCGENLGTIHETVPTSFNPCGFYCT
jgi:hypothetical protein